MDNKFESIVVGTAGHIDHGKTSLVKALTGYNTDTLDEEQQRGITINLGFAYFTLPNGKVMGIVDVPGHEKFIKNMLAGACGIDIAMVVIAANEGIMPQTKEHIDILSYLGIQKSVVVITKIDMVDDDFKELVLEDTKEYLSKTFLNTAPIIQVDCISGDGINELIKALTDISNQIQKPKQNKNVRLNVDRSFSIKGFGTVVTGTLSSGTIHINDKLMIYPKEISAKVRSLQVHQHDVDESLSGQRTAMNLSGISVDDVPRGSVISTKGYVSITKTIDIHFTVSNNTKMKISKMDLIKIYIGTKEVVAKINLLAQKEVSAGHNGYAQLLLDEYVAVRKDDCFVMRSITPVCTVGGGRIVNPLAKRYKKISDFDINLLTKKDVGSINEKLESFVYSFPFIDRQNLSNLVNSENMDVALEQMIINQKLICLSGCYIHLDYINSFYKEINRILENYHNEFPLRNGMPNAELQSQQQIVDENWMFSLVIARLQEKQMIIISESIIKLPNFTPKYSPEQLSIKKEIETRLLESKYEALIISEITNKDNAKIQVVESIIDDILVNIDGTYVIHKKYFDNAKQIVKEIANEKGYIRLSDLRDKLQISRKYALVLLERFDREKFTKRTGEDRILI